MRPLEEGTYKIVPGEFYDTPKEVWGFRKRVSGKTPLHRARSFLHANRELLGLSGVLKMLKKRDEWWSLGARHVILQQNYRRVPVHRGFVTVHMDSHNSVYLVKNRAMPRDMLGGEPGFAIGPRDAERAALDELGASKADTEHVRKPEKRWYPLAEILRPAFRVRVGLRSPREDWIVYVDAHDGSIIKTHDNLSLARAKARIFDPNPVIALGDYRLLLKGKKPITPTFAEFKKAYRSVDLANLADARYLEGPRVTTLPTKPRIEDGRFELQSGQRKFAEVMAYYHLDRAVAYVEALRYRGRRAIFNDRLAVAAHGTGLDESWYDPATKMLTFGTGDVNDAEDGETVLHEFGHALQDAIIPDFGQSYEAAAMGEGFGDYLAASYFAPRKRRLKRAYLVSVMTWDGVLFDETDPPCVRRVDSRDTYAAFVHQDDHEHENGAIWSATLWDIRGVLGRRRADEIIIESHFQLDAFTKFDKGARAILDADRNLCGGDHVSRLVDIFERRGIGPVA